MIGEARTEVGPQGGTVFVAGELWRATSRGAIAPGSHVRVARARNLDLFVEPWTEADNFD
jgi:membrane-bound ClpP family serine protease